jgi:hypothetical protein
MATPIRVMYDMAALLNMRGCTDDPLFSVAFTIPSFPTLRGVRPTPSLSIINIHSPFCGFPKLRRRPMNKRCRDIRIIILSSLAVTRVHSLSLRPEFPLHLYVFPFDTQFQRTGISFIPFHAILREMSKNIVCIYMNIGQNVNTSLFIGCKGIYIQLEMTSYNIVNRYIHTQSLHFPK